MTRTVNASEALVQPLDVLVFGAGLAGLTAAWDLHRDGNRVLLCQADGRIGGAISSWQIDGFLCEGGPHSFQMSGELETLIGQLDIADRLVRVDPRLPRYVWWEGCLRSVPLSPSQFIFSDLLSGAGKLRLAGELFVPRQEETREETVAEFFYRRFGAEVLDRLVDPFVSGVFAGDTGQLSIAASLPRLLSAERTAGSVLRALFRRAVARQGPSCAFREGMATLSAAIGERLGSSLWLHRPLLHLERQDGLWRATVGSPEAPFTLSAHAVVLATPAPVTARMVANLDGTLSRALASIYYPPLAVVSLGYRTTQMPQPLEGFGHLVPRSQGLRTLGSLWNCSMFPGRAPAGWRQFTSFLGGTTDTDAVALSDGELEALAHRELVTILGLQGRPRLLRITRWPQAIPQYALGHTAKQERIEATLAGWPGLFLVGNYFGGVAVGDVVRHTLAAARRARGFLARVDSAAGVLPG
jgi:oxygen-dependent protoporphyrinogen oxidase